jgi:hypothetical protein
MIDAVEVEEEIARLKDMKPHVRKTTHFGDDNHAAIDAQVLVLEKRMDSDQIWNEWPEEEEDAHRRGAAMEAQQWLSGQTEDLPSAEWEARDTRRKS